jgi:hypothetical protein
MHRWLVILLGIGLAPPIAAQGWNDVPTRSLVARAVARRLGSFADSTLRSYRARARGVVTFRADLGRDLGLPPRTLKVDELAVEVYWQRPDRSKQNIRAWRDGTFLPSGIGYHRDHLGIVTDDFGPIIRVGDGDEVADVVHPFAPDGPERYDYRLGDAVAIQTSGRRLVLVSLEVRPKNLRGPAVVGTLFLDRDRAQVVRSHLTFTPAAYRDRSLEDITVRLERTLIENRYWMPLTQEIEIRRRSPVVDFPLRGVIRGDWRIGDYELNPDLSAVVWSGASIAGLRRPQPDTGWEVPLARVADSSLGPVTTRELAAVRALAARVVRTRLLDGLPRLGFSISRLSDVAVANRVQGLVVGGGLGWRGSVIDEIAVRAGYGFGDRRLVGRVEARRAVGSWALRARASRMVEDVGEVEPSSRLVNSITQLWGEDRGDYVLMRRIGIEALRPIGASSRITFGLRREWSSSVDQPGSLATDRPNASLGSPPQWTVAARVESARAGLDRESSVSIAVEGGVPDSARYGRIVAFGQVSRRVGSGFLGLRALAGLVTAEAPARRSIAFGGAGTMVGEGFRRIGGQRAAWAALEWLVQVPGPSVRLGWLGQTGQTMRVGPVVALGTAGGKVDGVPWTPPSSVPVVAGLAVELFDWSLRVEVGKSITSGRGPAVTVDVNRTWWPII